MVQNPNKSRKFSCHDQHFMFEQTMSKFIIKITDNLAN